MTIQIKDKSTIVNEIITNLSAVLPSNTDFTDGSVLRTMIESFAQQIEFQYWQLEQIYKNSFVDTAIGSSLDNIALLVGVIRNPAVKSIGYVSFTRSTPAPNDLYIPSSTIIETLKDAKGNSVKFETLNDAIIPQGQNSVTVQVRCLDAGISGNIPSNTITIINNPPIGVESVINTSPITGGLEAETDNELRDRAKYALDSKGLGTIDALLYQLKTNPSVQDISVLDMNRGIGTADILVLGTTIPLIQSVVDNLNQLIYKTKAAGIDIKLLQPNVINQNFSLVVTLNSGYIVSDVSSTVQNSIVDFINNLKIGQTLILNQLERRILNDHSDSILDIKINTPSSNITIGSQDIIRAGTIAIS